MNQIQNFFTKHHYMLLFCVLGRASLPFVSFNSGSFQSSIISHSLSVSHVIISMIPKQLFVIFTQLSTLFNKCQRRTLLKICIMIYIKKPNFVLILDGIFDKLRNVLSISLFHSKLCMFLSKLFLGYHIGKFSDSIGI